MLDKGYNQNVISATLIILFWIVQSSLPLVMLCKLHVLLNCSVISRILHSLIYDVTVTLSEICFCMILAHLQMWEVENLVSIGYMPKTVLSKKKHHQIVWGPLGQKKHLFLDKVSQSGDLYGYLGFFFPSLFFVQPALSVKIWTFSALSLKPPELSWPNLVLSIYTLGGQEHKIVKFMTHTPNRHKFG